MATKIWVKTNTIWCERRKEKVDLLEERIYPGDVIPDTGVDYQVNARKCTEAIDCNIIGMACAHSGLNPDYDPFLER